MIPDRCGGAGTPVLRVPGSTPYPWPYDGRLEGRRLALVVVLPDAAQALPDAAAVVPAMAAAADLATAVAAAGGAVVRVVPTRPLRRLHPTPAPDRTGDGDAAAGAQVPAAASGWGLPVPGHHVTAAGWDGFYGSALDAVLRSGGRTHLLLAGAPLETAVHSTLRSANDRGYECLLVADACAALAPPVLRNTLSMIEMSGGIFGAVGTTSDILTAITAAQPATR